MLLGTELHFNSLFKGKTLNGYNGHYISKNTRWVYMKFIQVILSIKVLTKTTFLHKQLHTLHKPNDRFFEITKTFDQA